MNPGRRSPATILSIVLGLSLLGVPPGTVAQSGEEPVFHLPFPCGETWTASTRTGHSPSIDAVDFNRTADAGAQVLAGAEGGTVSAKGEESGYGHYVRVAYAGDVELLLAHLQEPSALDIDDPIGAQTVVGLVGSSGLTNSDAHHLHYEQRVGGVLRPVVIEGESWQVGEQVADDRDDLAANPGIAHTSRNCSGSGSDTDEPGDAIPVAQWIEPVEGATVGPQLTLAAWPSPSLVDGSLVDATDIVRVDFRASWPGGSAHACSASAADPEKLWSCTVGLVSLGVPAGPVELSFDVLRTDGSTLSAPDGATHIAFETEPSLSATWSAPKKHAKLSDSTTVLAAKAADSPTALGIERVVFHTQWAKRKAKRACVATKSNNQGIWSCKVDLWEVGAPLGGLTLSFDVVDREGGVANSPAGIRTVRFAAKPPRPKASYEQLRLIPGPEELYAADRAIFRVQWQAPAGSATQYDIYHVLGTCFATRPGQPCIREGLSGASLNLQHVGTVKGSKRSFTYERLHPHVLHQEDVVTAILVQATNQHGRSKSGIAYSLKCRRDFGCPSD